MNRKTTSFIIEDADEFKQQALKWADDNFSTVLYCDNNHYKDYPYSTYEGLIAAGVQDSISLSSGNAFQKLKDFYEQKKDWLFGFLGYDLKNEIEHLTSKNQDGLNFPDLFFFQPEWVIEIHKRHAVVHSSLTPPLSKGEGDRTLFPFGTKTQFNTEFFSSSIEKTHYRSNSPLLWRGGGGEAFKLQSRISKSDYLRTVEKIQQHIFKGDIYEMNYCQEFFAEDATLNLLDTFIELNELSKAPFTCYLKHNENYLLSGSPERFLKKNGNKLISMPIKGTAKRGKTFEEDALLREKLLSDQKERSENVMIVDLVRNDLSRSCNAGSVNVEELFGIKTFEQVHQMVSTISGTLREEVHFIDAIKNAFPMGSMTGAPKVRAMELIEQYEKSKRGLYSGAIGYISPDGDFDFNVVIRSLLYNSINQYLSLHVGSAITVDSVPEKEYEECLLKAKALREVLKSSVVSQQPSVGADL
ncbi:MAG: anthranilate synthase component I family protein [Chitinophagales bacterium]|nr:anthranilate synthase component I family protein [Chitinophagales bacterium]